MFRRFFFVVVPFLLVSCVPRIPEPVPLPQGSQEIFGQLQPTPLSITRRGTHVLVQEGVKRVYVESSVVNLRPLEWKIVTLRGRFEQNTDPADLPVFMVRNVESEDFRDIENETEESGVSETGSLLERQTTNIPCGGSAGILCPDGMVCVVEDITEQIGHCRMLQKRS